MLPQEQIDPSRYRKLVSKATPVIIETEEENERVLAIIESILKKGDRATPEEDSLLKLLSRLVEDYESKAYPVDDQLPPAGMVAFLLEQRNLKPIALEHVLGSRGRVSEILSGKRSISKAQAVKLAAFFHVGVECFIA